MIGIPADATKAEANALLAAADDADVRARTVYLTQIGYISMQVRETPELRLTRVRGYVRTFCGSEPTEAEMNRFRARLRM